VEDALRAIAAGQRRRVTENLCQFLWLHYRPPTVGALTSAFKTYWFRMAGYVLDDQDTFSVRAIYSSLIQSVRICTKSPVHWELWLYPWGGGGARPKSREAKYSPSSIAKGKKGEVALPFSITTSCRSA
jgi:hypothetical protein